MTLPVDGRFGYSTCIELQKRLNARGRTPQLAVDGQYGPRTSAALEWYVAQPQTSSLFPDTGYNPQTVAFQQRINAAWGGRLIDTDGKWGPLTTEGLQITLNNGSF